MHKLRSLKRALQRRYGKAKKHWQALGQRARKPQALTETAAQQPAPGEPVPELGPGWVRIKKRNQEPGQPTHSFKVCRRYSHRWSRPFG